ncbi:hypothetical protein Peur_003937 [Populus x canadensis]
MVCCDYSMILNFLDSQATGNSPEKLFKKGEGLGPLRFGMEKKVQTTQVEEEEEKDNREFNCLQSIVPVLRIAITGGLGLARNSSATIAHVITNDPSIILLVGDPTYANQYLTTGGKGAPCCF